MAALFIAQMLSVELTLFQQLMVVLTSVVASVGAAGIPEAGLVCDDAGLHGGQPTAQRAYIACCSRWTGSSTAVERW